MTSAYEFWIKTEIISGKMYSQQLLSPTQMRRTVVSTLTRDSVLRHWSLLLSVLVTLVCIVRLLSSTVTIWCLVLRLHSLKSVLISCGKPIQQTFDSVKSETIVRSFILLLDGLFTMLSVGLSVSTLTATGQNSL